MIQRHFAENTTLTPRDISPAIRPKHVAHQIGFVGALAAASCARRRYLAGDLAFYERSIVLDLISNKWLQAALHAPAPLARYAGANTSVTNDSIVVGVVFFAERCSCGTIRPAFALFHISINSAAVFLGNPI
jgi:hypothetical protein